MVPGGRTEADFQNYDTLKLARKPRNDCLSLDRETISSSYCSDIFLRAWCNSCSLKYKQTAIIFNLKFYSSTPNDCIRISILRCRVLCFYNIDVL